MKIEAVEATFPSRILGNDEILALIREHSLATFEGDLEKTLYIIWEGLRFSGAKTRRWLAAGETPLQLIAASVDRALETAGCTRDDIDLMIFSGVDRGFAEPSNANLIADVLGMPRVQCFDILEACNGWSRALQVSHALFSAGAYRRIMILDSEFQMFPGGTVFPALYRLHAAEDIASRLPGYTLGEVATATILSGAGSLDWEFHFCGRNDFADLCTVPLQGYERYCGDSNRIGRNGVGVFTSFARELFAVANDPAIDLFRRLRVPVGDIQAIFPHTASKTAPSKVATSLGVEHLMYYVYPEYGNLVSASVPAALANAIRENRVRRGDRIVGWVASAGMSWSAYAFDY